MTSLQYKLLGGALLVAIGIGGWSIYAKRAGLSAQHAAETRVAVLEGQVKELAAQKAEIADERNQLAEKNKDLQKTADEWRKKASSWRQPPSPPPPPESDPELAKSLIGLGFVDGLKVTPEGAGTMPRADASLAYLWQGLAAQLPTYQTQVQTQAQAIQAGSLAIDGLKLELVTSDKQRGLVQREADLQRDKATAQEEATQAVKKQLSAEKPRKWFYAAGAALLVVLVKR